MNVTEALLPRQRDVLLDGSIMCTISECNGSIAPPTVVLLDGSIMCTISECNGGVAPPTESCVVRWQHNVYNQ